MSERTRAKDLLAKLGMSERRKQIYEDGIDRATDADLASASDGLEHALNNVDAGLAAADRILARRRAHPAPESPPSSRRLPDPRPALPQGGVVTNPSVTRGNYRYFTIPFASVPTSPPYPVWFATWTAAQSGVVWSRTRPAAPTFTVVCAATEGSVPAGATVIGAFDKCIDPPPLAVASNVSETDFRKALQMQLAAQLDTKNYCSLHATMPHVCRCVR